METLQGAVRGLLNRSYVTAMSQQVIWAEMPRNPVGSIRPAVRGRSMAEGYQDPEPQQSLFSWAVFMAEEPVKPKGRNRKRQPATASLFEWALEQEREPVGDNTLDRNTGGSHRVPMTPPCTGMYVTFSRFRPVCSPAP